MKHDLILHIIRNPWGWSEDEVRAARLAAADLIEDQAKRIAELERLNLTFAQNEQDIEALRGFAHDIIEFWPHGSLSGGDLQDFAIKHGILAPTEVTESCGEFCECSEYGGFPTTCYRKPELLTWKIELNARNSESVGEL